MRARYSAVTKRAGNPSRSVKDELHELVDQLDEEAAGGDVRCAA
jgi:hypothetical protein